MWLLLKPNYISSFTFKTYLKEQKDVLAILCGRPTGGHQDGEARRHLRPRWKHLGTVRRILGKKKKEKRR